MQDVPSFVSPTSSVILDSFFLFFSCVSCCILFFSCLTMTTPFPINPDETYAPLDTPQTPNQRKKLQVREFFRCRSLASMSTRVSLTHFGIFVIYIHLERISHRLALRHSSNQDPKTFLPPFPKLREATPPAVPASRPALLALERTAVEAILSGMPYHEKTFFNSVALTPKIWMRSLNPNFV